MDWNHLEDDIVDAPSSEGFRKRLANSQYCLYVAGLPCSLSLSLSLSPTALIPVLVLQCISTNTDTENEEKH